MKDLIQQATTFAESGVSFTGAEVRLWIGKLTDALARATAVSLQPAHDQVTIECLNDKVMYLMGQIERLTAGSVELPEPTIEFMSGHREPVEIYDAADIIDYGNRKDAAGYLRGVLAERERCADFCDFWDATSAKKLAEEIRKGTP